MPDPVVSVVIPTHNRPERLERCLNALRGQDQDRASFEVIVVDDGSSGSTGEVLRAELGRNELQLRVLRHDSPRGPAAARNAGWREARAPLVAFTDDDCRPAPGWLATALASTVGHPEAILQGRTEPDPDECTYQSLTTHTVQRAGLGPSYETCNMFYPRAVLEVLGGFDTRFLSPVGEDTDLAWRAFEHGFQAAYAPDAVVFHAVERVGIRGKLRLAQRWTPSIRVLAEHPQSRIMLERGIFWNVWHYLLWRSVLALLGPRWLRRFVLSRHLLALRARGREAGAGPWSVPFLLVYDVVETAAILRGAIRYRTLVL